MNSEVPVTRSIDFYEKNGEEFLGQFDISQISLPFLLEIVSPNEDDPLLYDSYLLEKLQLDKINGMLKTPIEYSLHKYEYFLGCTAIEGYYSNINTVD